MPCIEKPRKNAKESWSSYCGKMMSVNKPSFKNVEAAYKGDEPICPKCRKVLNLPKKEIKTRITSMKISTRDKLVIVYYNNKDSIEIDIIVDDFNGIFIKDFSPIPDDKEQFEQILGFIQTESRQFIKRKINRLEFEKEDVDLLKKIIAESSNKSERERLSLIKDKIGLFILKHTY